MHILIKQQHRAVSLPCGITYIFEIAYLSDEKVAMFQSDFKIVANFFVNKRRNKNYVPDDKTTFRHVDEVLKLLSVMTGDNRYEQILADKKGVKNMCDVAQRLEDRGIQKGMQRGINIIYSLVQDGLISPETGADRLGISVKKLKANMMNTGYQYPDGK